MDCWTADSKESLHTKLMSVSSCCNPNTSEMIRRRRVSFAAVAVAATISTVAAAAAASVSATIPPSFLPAPLFPSPLLPFALVACASRGWWRWLLW